MSSNLNRQLVLQAMLMVLWQRESRRPVILYSDPRDALILPTGTGSDGD